MANELKFGSQTICDDPDTVGDVYNRVNSGNRPMLDVSRVTFPGTKGAELRVIGNQQSIANALVIRYGVSNGKPSFIFKSSEANMLTHLSNIDTFRLNEDNLTGSLVDRHETLTGMYWSKFSTSDIFAVNNEGTDKFCVFFEAEFIRITAP